MGLNTIDGRISSPFQGKSIEDCVLYVRAPDQKLEKIAVGRLFSAAAEDKS